MAPHFPTPSDSGSELDKSQLYTALPLSASADRPSATSVQWSSDGQLIVVTKSAIHIYTPDLGIAYDKSSAIKLSAVRSSRQSMPNDGVTFGWFKTMIEFDKALLHQWPLYCDEWGALSLGSLDASWRAVTISPNTVSKSSGCLLVTLTTGSEVTVWESSKDHLTGAWRKIQDVTQTLRELPIQPRDELFNPEKIDYVKTLQCQVTYLSWSRQADFRLQPSPLIDGSLLALANRRGSIILMRCGAEPLLRSVGIIRVSDKWVTHVAWSSWICEKPYFCVAYIACGIADGSIEVVKISQTLEYSGAGYNRTFDVKISYDILPSKPALEDGKKITALEWVEPKNNTARLIHAKPGVVNCWVLDAGSHTENGPQSSISLRLRSTDVSDGYACFSPVSGLFYDNSLDILIVGLHDGSFHVIYDVSGSPTLDPSTPDDVYNSAAISRTIRDTCTQTGEDSMEHFDVNKTSGFVSFDGWGTIVWLHQPSRPFDFSYVAEANHQSFLVTARIMKGPSIEKFLSYLREATTGYSLDAPNNVLRPVFLHLRSYPEQLDLFADVIFDITKPISLQNTATLTIPSWTNGVDSTMRSGFRQSLKERLRGWRELTALRLRLAVVDFVWASASPGSLTDAFRERSKELLQNISHRILQTICVHIGSVVSIMTANDMPFVFRMLVQSLLPGLPPDLEVYAKELVHSLEQSPSLQGGGLSVSENCPACNAEVPLTDILSARCPNGHMWARCSITSFLLSTTKVRTCIGCNRKALLAPSQLAGGDQTALPREGQSWVVEELLEAAGLCLYCGNRFIRIL